MHVEQRARKTAKLLLAEALAEYRVLQVWEQERLALAERSLSNGTEVEHFGVRELLAGLVGAILPDGLGSAEPSLAWDTQLELVKRLKALYVDASLPEEVSSQVLYHLGQVREVALTEFRRADQAGASAGWRACAREGEECNCSGLVRYGNPLAWSTPVAVAQSTHCGNKAFGGDPSPKKPKYCECLATQPQEGDLRRSHLLLLLRELSGVFCGQGGGKPWPWASGNSPSAADCIGELRAAASEAGA